MDLSFRKYDFLAIGTSWSIDINHLISDKEFALITGAVALFVEDFDVTYSRFRSDSLVAQISNQPGSYTFPEHGAKLFNCYWNLYKATGQKVTPLIGDLMVQTGYDAVYSLQPTTDIRPVQKWEDVMTYKHPILLTNTAITLDFGAAGKGYLIDLIGSILNDYNIQDYCIDGSGDYLFKNSKAQTVDVGLGNPNDPTEVIGVAQVSDSICGSSAAYRQWAGRHHIMDPDTTESVSDIIASWVTAKTALIADGIATALFFSDPDQLKKYFTFEFMTLDKDMRCSRSNGFTAQLFEGQAV